MRPSIRKIWAIAAVALSVLAPYSVHSQQQVISSQMAAARCPGMGSIVSSVVVDLSSYCANSYPGNGQTLANIEDTPANSEAQTYSNFYLGAGATATATDPTFTGLAGHHGAHWSHDGGDYFSHTAGAGPSTFFGDMHREDTSQSWGVWVAFKFVQTDVTLNIAGTSNGTATQGWQFQTSSTKQFNFKRNDGAALSVTTTLHAANSLVNGASYIVFFNYTNNTRAWNSKLYSTGVSVASTSGTATTNPLCTSTTVGIMSVGTANNSSSAVGSASGINTRIYEVGFTNAVMSDGDIANIEAQIEFRTGVDFTP